MLHAIGGRLAEEPKLREIKSKEGNPLEVVNVNIYVYPGKNAGEDIPVKIVAWGDAAKELAGYKKGEEVQFVGQTKEVGYKPSGMDKEFKMLGYQVVKIDPERNIVKNYTDMLSKYINDKEMSLDAGMERGM